MVSWGVPSSSMSYHFHSRSHFVANKKKKGKKEKKREKTPKQQKKKKMLVVMDLFQTAVSAEFTMLNVLPFRKELLSSKAEELLSVFVCFFF